MTTPAMVFEAFHLPGLAGAWATPSRARLGLGSSLRQPSGGDCLGVQGHWAVAFGPIAAIESDLSPKRGPTFVPDTPHGVPG